MANKEFKTRIKNKRDTAANWESKNPVILNGEIILVDTSTGELRAKIGNGTKKYNELSFSDEVLKTLITNVENKIPTSLPANGGNACTVDGKHAEDFATAAEFKSLVGDKSVAEQVTAALTSAKEYTDDQIEALESGTVANATKAETATKADTATEADHAASATEADHATSADNATEAGHATSADSATTAGHATSADSATTADKATKDGKGNIIADTYETKTDATAKLTAAKSYTDAEIAEWVGDKTVATQISNAVGGITPAGIGAAASGHNHDTAYAPKTHTHSEYAASSHGNHVPTTQTASNKVFLRNDNTWQTVTPANIGAAEASHGTHVSYGTSATAVGATAAAGSASTVSRSDHTHSLSKSAVTTALGYTPPTSDTKNTAGSTNTSSKIFLIGATSQGDNPQTYSHDTVYVGTDGCLYSNNSKVLTSYENTKVTQAYSTTDNIYPLLLSATAGVTSTSSRGATTAILNNGLYANPSKGNIYAKNQIQADGSFYTKGFVQSDGNMVCGGQLSSTGKIYGGGQIEAATSFYTSGYITAGGNLTCNNNATIAGTLGVTGITTIASRIQPNSDNNINCGYSSAKWLNVYCKNAANTTSDLNEKKDLKEIDDRYIALFDLVQPYTYMFKNGDRVHTGFISQYVEEAMKKVGLTAEEVGFFCKDVKTELVFDDEGNYVEDKPVYDEDGNLVYSYALRYGEYIAIMAEKIKRLEAHYNSKLEELEKRLEAIEG